MSDIPTSNVMQQRSAGSAARSSLSPASTSSTQYTTERSTRSYVNIAHYGQDNQCPICLIPDAILPIETNCGHLFCAACIINYWHHGDYITAIPCPVCRQSVSVLLQCFRVNQSTASSSSTSNSSSSSSRSASDAQTAQSAQSNNGILQLEQEPDEQYVQRIVHEINDYNRRFSGSRPWIDYLWDLPIMLRHLSIEFFTGSLVYFFRLRIIFCFITGVMYLISPLDMIPEAIYGLFGFLDDIFVLILIAIYLTMIYRNILASRWADE